MALDTGDRTPQIGGNARDRGSKATIWHELALAAGLVLFAGTLAFGANYLRLSSGQATTAGQSEKPSALPTTSPVSPLNSSPLTGPLLPSEAEAILKARVTEINPVLVPTAVPSAAEAFVSAAANRYSVEYKTPSLDIVLSTGAKEMVSGGTTQKFRGVEATYYVTDPGAPQEGQLLFWTEPSLLNRGGIRYFLKAGGMSAAQFWQLANSIRPLQ